MYGVYGVYSVGAEVNAMRMFGGEEFAKVAGTDTEKQDCGRGRASAPATVPAQPDFDDDTP